MTDFSDLLEDIKTEVENIGRKHFSDYTEQALKDGQKIVANLQGELQEWHKQLLEGELNPQEFQFLLEQKKDLSRLQALKQQGIAKIKLEKFQNEVIQSISKLTIEQIS